MKILIVHQVPYEKIQYHAAIDHDEHDVHYFGTPSKLREIPKGLQCTLHPMDPQVQLFTAIAEIALPSDGYDAVLSLSEFGLEEAVGLRRHLGLTEPRGREALAKVRDKVLMKDAVAQAGLRVPRFSSCIAALNDLPTWVGPTIVKPRRGASSEGVTRHESVSDALALFQKGAVDPACYQIEEFIEGPICHLDGVMIDAMLITISGSRYYGSPLDYARQHTPLASAQVAIGREELAFTKEVATALDMHTGAFHIEYFQTPQGPVFLEAANRMGGAGVEQAHRLRTGISIPKTEIAAHLGFPLPEPRPPSSRWHGWLVYSGRAHSFRSVPDFVSQSSIVHRIEHTGAENIKVDGISYRGGEANLYLETSASTESELGDKTAMLVETIVRHSERRVP